MYKDAIIYQLHLKSFFDSNNERCGRFPRACSRSWTISPSWASPPWLLPFYPSPRRDDGYDIADYRGVHPDYGSLADARAFVQSAHERGIRVITEW